MMMKPNDHNLISIIIPAYNEAQSLEELYQRTKKVMNSIGVAFEFIVIDDGSNDGTFDLLKDMRKRNANIGIIRHQNNGGKSLALMQGFASASGHAAITMDADLQDEPENIPAMLKKLSEGYDLVNGYRIRRRDKWTKKLISRMFNMFTSVFLKTKMRDINCGLKVMSRHLYKTLELRGDLHRLIPTLAVIYGFSVAEVGVTHADRKYGKSKYRLVRHRGLLDIIALVVSQTSRYRPFYVLCEVAMVLWGLLIIDVIAIILMARSAPPSISLIANVPFDILLFTAVVLIFMGILLPIAGILLDVLSAPHQDTRWRQRVISHQLAPEIE